jgi:GNAT superfamily N-acetyltransferase
MGCPPELRCGSSSRARPRRIPAAADLAAVECVRGEHSSSTLPPAVSDPHTAPSFAIRELPAGETHLVHEAMRTLRAAHGSEQEFVKHVDGVLRPAGYRLVGAFIPDRAQALAVAGFRTADSLAWGHYLYVDDLSTVPDARRRGHAGALLDWLGEEGRRLGCGQLHLDSGTGPERFDAHRLYQNHGLAIYSHHFARGL